MRTIPISSPIDYFEITVPLGQLIWNFTFTWNSTYSLFYVDVFLNGQPYIYSVAVLGGVFVLPDFSKGYNFFFVGNCNAIEDLGTQLKMMQILTVDAEAAGFLL